MDLKHLSAIGIYPAPEEVVVSSGGKHAERFFVLKSKTREPLVRSQTQSVWALRAHANCSKADQPHARLATAQNESLVILLFAENSEHAWVGYATMNGAPWYEEGGVEFPHTFRVDWKVLLPHAQGISFRFVAGESHKVFNADEIDHHIGCTIRAALDEKSNNIRLQQESAELAFLNSGFLSIVPGETELEAHRRLLQEVQARLGGIIVACLCGSRRYNLHFPDSDFDLLVVYASSDPEKATPVIKNPDGLHPDYTLLEARKFAQMLREGDPRMIESLFLQDLDNARDMKSTQSDDDQSTVLCFGDPWLSLLHLRDFFISKELVQKYLGDATGRAGLSAIRKNLKQEKHRKILYVAFRALQNAMQACSSKTLKVRRATGSAEHTFIMEVRNGENGSVEELLPQAEMLADDVRVALQKSNLKELGDAQFLNQWLLEVHEWARASHFKG